MLVILTPATVPEKYISVCTCKRIAISELRFLLSPRSILILFVAKDVEVTMRVLQLVPRCVS